MGLAFMAVMELALVYFRSFQRWLRRWIRSLRPHLIPAGFPILFDACYSKKKCSEAVILYKDKKRHGVW